MYSVRTLNVISERALNVISGRVANVLGHACLIILLSKDLYWFVPVTTSRKT